MYIDYVRVYQPNNNVNIGCDPKDHPTHDYIQECVSFPFGMLAFFSFLALTMPTFLLLHSHIAAYSNANCEFSLASGLDPG